jgi:hypothetical protein
MTCMGRLHCQAYYLYPFASGGYSAHLLMESLIIFYPGNSLVLK